MEKVTSFKTYLSGKKTINLSVEVYNLTKKFPRNEFFGLTNHLILLKEMEEIQKRVLFCTCDIH